jgi:signal transduction histidine kinase
VLSQVGDLVRIEIGDRGRGFAPGAVLGKGEATHGLRRIEQRMQLLGGRMQVAAAPGQGTRITLHVPMRLREGRRL